MKRSSFLTLFALLLIAGFLTSCGGGGAGAPGSCNTEKTGVILDISISPYYQKPDYLTYSVDIIRNICVTPEGVEYDEYFADHSANIGISARLINPTPSIQPGTLYIEKYTIEYIRANDSIGAPPIEFDTKITLGEIVINPPESGTGSTKTIVEGPLVDLKRKNKYLEDIRSDRFDTNIPHKYTAIYRFEGKNQYGKDFCAVATTNFQIGSFDYCGITPKP